MKSSLNFKSAIVKPFPKMMKHSGSDLVVLFSTNKQGIVINEGASPVINFLGRYSEDWHMESFEEFSGIIALEQ